MMNISASRFRILFNNVDYTSSVSDSVKFTANWDENKGLCLVTGSVTLNRTNESSLPIEPENNPNVFIGGTCIYEEYDYASSTYVRHAHFGHTIVQTVPRPINSDKSYYIKGITVELSCRLEYLSEKDLTGDCTQILPGQSLTRRQVINNLITKASGGQGLLNDSAEPSDLITYPPESLNSIIDTAGLLALMSPDEPWFLWADGYGEFRLTKESDALNNTIILSSEDKDCIPERIDSGDFGRPFSELKVNSVIQTIRQTPSIDVQDNETYTTLNELYNLPSNFVSTNPLVGMPIPKEKKVSRIETDFNSFMYITTIYETTILVVNRGNGGTDSFTANGSPPNSVLPTSARIATNTLIEERFGFYPKPANWDSCNPENNPVSLAGLISDYNKVIYRLELAENSLTKFLEESRNYTYDKDRWLRRRETSIAVLTRKEGSYITQDGRSIQKFEKALGKIETWDRVSCDGWVQTVTETGPGGNSDAPVRYDSNITTSAPIITKDSPPSADGELPRRYTVCEETIEVVSTIKVNNVYNKTKPISFPFATSKEQLQKLSDNRIKLTYQKAYGGMSFEIPAHHSYFTQNTATPIFSVLFTEPDGTQIKLRSLRTVHESDFNSAVLIIDSAKVGTLNQDDDLVEIGQSVKKIDFLTKNYGSIITSKFRKPTISKTISFRTKSSLYRLGTSWFDISRADWFTITREKFFSIKR